MDPCEGREIERGPLPWDLLGARMGRGLEYGPLVLAVPVDARKWSKCGAFRDMAASCQGDSDPSPSGGRHLTWIRNGPRGGWEA